MGNPWHLYSKLCKAEPNVIHMQRNSIFYVPYSSYCLVKLVIVILVNNLKQVAYGLKFKRKIKVQC